MSVSVSTGAASSLRSSRPSPSGPDMTFSSAVMCGNRLNCWNTIPVWMRTLRICSRLRRVRWPPPRRCAGDLDRAVGGVLEEVHAAQQGGLAGSGPAEDDDDLPLVQLEVDPAQHLVVAVDLAQPGDPDHDLARHPTPPPAPRAGTEAGARRARNRWPSAPRAGSGAARTARSAPSRRARPGRRPRGS